MIRPLTLAALLVAIAIAPLIARAQGVTVPTMDDLRASQYDDSDLRVRLDALTERLQAIETALADLSEAISPGDPPVDPPVDPDEPTVPDPPVEPGPPIEPPAPPVDQLPEDSQIIPIMLPNGDQWTGLTNPPPTTFRSDHPRMLVTPESLPGLREKLSHPGYETDVAMVQQSSNASDKAFCYLVWGDEEKGRQAINALLNWSHSGWHSAEKAGKDMQGVLMYDWLYDLMTEDERQQATDVLRSNITRGSDVRYYHSDHLTDHTYDHYLMNLALDDDIAAEYRQLMLDPQYKGFKIYRGLLDILTQSSLQYGGGWHAGNHTSPLGGYEGGYATQGAICLRAWETCTGQPMFDKTTYFDRKPHDFLYSRLGIQNTGGENKNMRIANEFYTGINSDKSAGLARYLMTRIGRMKNTAMLVPRLILGDRRIEPVSPEELALPTWGYLDGNNCVFAHAGFEDEDFKCLFFARAWDRGRFEQFTSSLAIHKGGRKIIPLNTDWKAIGMDGYTGLRITDSPNIRQNRTYGTVEGHFPEEIVDPNKPQFRPETLTHLSEENGIITATARFEHLVPVSSPPEICQRTVQIDPQSETVQVNDYVVGLGTNDCLITFGLNEAPVINGNVIENSDVRITMQTEFTEIWWDETEAETDSRGSRWIVGTLKIRPVVADGTVNAQTLVEVK